MTHIDPKAPANSPQHPRNWHRDMVAAPTFTMDAEPPAAVPEPPQEPATPAVEPVPPAPKKAAGKKTTTRRKAPGLAEALAKLDEQ